MPCVVDASSLVCPTARIVTQDQPGWPDFSLDAAVSEIREYTRHVENLLDSRGSDSSGAAGTPMREVAGGTKSEGKRAAVPRGPHSGAESHIEYSYSRLFGTRGNICRICPPAEMHRLGRRTLHDWEWAETRLRGYLSGAANRPEVVAVVRRVESGWTDSMARYIDCLSSRLPDYSIPDQLGILKGIDTVGMHLAQREIFALTQSMAIPLENAHAVKLHVRLLVLFLALNRCQFRQAFPAIRSYRSAFGILDPVAYPWWFVDSRLTERDLNWTYRRIPTEALDWRF